MRSPFALASDPEETIDGAREGESCRTCPEHLNRRIWRFLLGYGLMRHSDPIVRILIGAVMYWRHSDSVDCPIAAQLVGNQPIMCVQAIVKIRGTFTVIRGESREIGRRPSSTKGEWIHRFPCAYVGLGSPLFVFTEDIEWHPPESAPLEVVKAPQAVAAELGGDTPKRIFDMKTFRPKIHRMLADRDIAVVQHSNSAKTKEGEQYDNEYCWVYLSRDGKIAKIEEYADTLKAARVMKWG